jgi:hypothetical protein
MKPKGECKFVLGELIKNGYVYVEKCNNDFILAKGSKLVVYNLETDTIISHYTFHEQ